MTMATRITRMISIWFAALAVAAVSACGENADEGNRRVAILSPDSTVETPRLDEPSGSPTPGSAMPTPTSPKPPSSTTKPPAGDTSLTIIVIDGPNQQPRTWELSCDPPGGTHPDPAAACGAIIAGVEKGDPFAPVPEGTFCTEIYGGPQEASIKGTWRGERISAKFSRHNGCEIARWDTLLAVFQGPLSPTRG